MANSYLISGHGRHKTMSAITTVNFSSGAAISEKRRLLYATESQHRGERGELGQRCKTAQWGKTQFRIIFKWPILPFWYISVPAHFTALSHPEIIRKSRSVKLSRFARILFQLALPYIVWMIPYVVTENNRLYPPIISVIPYYPEQIYYRHKLRSRIFKLASIFLS